MSVGRKRALPGLKSVAAAKQVEAAREWVRRHLNLRGEIDEPRPDLRWTKRLPGYQDARTSAVEAATEIFAETGFVREIAATHQSEYPTVVDRWSLKSGIGSPNEIIARLVGTTAPDRLPKLLHEISRDLYNAQRNGTSQWPVIRAIARNPGLFAQGPRIAYDDIGELYFVGKRSPLRANFPAVWISSALWVAEIPDMAAVLETRLKGNFELADLPRPKEATLRRWISELELFRYQGRGRLQFDQQGRGRADHVLVKEMTRARHL